MSLSKFIKILNKKAVLAYILKLIKLLSLVFTIPFIVSIISKEFDYTFVLGIIILSTLVIGFFERLVKVDEFDLSIKEAVTLTALSYLIYAILGAFLFSHFTTYINGFFESMSGFTTTGLSVINPEKLPNTLLFFRAYSQWIGGAGIIVITLVVLVNPGKTAIKLYSSEAGKESLVGNVKNTSIIVLRIYAVFTVIGFLMYWISGVNVFDSLLYILSTISTGGFSPHNSSVGFYNLTAFKIFVIIFMIIGASSFSSIYSLFNKGIKEVFKSAELKYLIGILLIFTFLFFAAWNFQPTKILSSFFESTTALTTTGFTIETPSKLPLSVKLMKIFLMIIGGSSSSTAGGIKIIRLILMIYLIRWMVLRIILPNEAKLPLKIRGNTFSDDEIKKVFSFIAAYILIIFTSSIIFTFYNYSITNSIFETTSALGTVGLSTGITSASMPVLLKFVLIFDMWAGRLEIFPLLVLLYPRLWFNGGNKK